MVRYEEEKEVDKIGVIHGRFQVFHNDHLKYILEGKKRCDHLIIGICKPEVELTECIADPHRSKRSANPMTYFERMECIRDALLEAGVPRSEFDLVPFPIDTPERIFHYVPENAAFYMSIYDEWGREKYHVLKDDLGLDVRVMWEVRPDQKGISASTIRERIFENREWSDLVPDRVYEYIMKNGIDQRIREYMEAEQ